MCQLVLELLHSTTYSSYIVGERQNSALSVPSCICANDLSFKRCVFQVVKSCLPWWKYHIQIFNLGLESTLRSWVTGAWISPSEASIYRNFVAEHNFFLRNIIAVRNFDRPLIAALSLHKIHKAAIHHVHFFNMLNYVSEIYESYTLQAVLRSLQCHGSVSWGGVFSPTQVMWYHSLQPSHCIMLSRHSRNYYRGVRIS